MRKPWLRFLSIAFSLFLFVIVLGDCSSPFTGNSSVGSAPNGSGSNVHRTWTVLVYMGADNNLSSTALSALNDMETADGYNSGVSVIALIDRVGLPGSDTNWDGARLYEVGYDSTTVNSTIVSTRLASSQLGLFASGTNNIDMGSADTLKHFIDFGKSAYPADHYAVILWGHGIGWRSVAGKAPTSSFSSISRGVIYDSGSGQSLYTDRIRQGLSGEGVEVLGIDASFSALMEHAYELKDSVGLLVASENNAQESPWNYANLLTKLYASHADAVTVANDIVDSYSETYANTTQSTIGIIDETKIASVNTAFNAFSTAVHDALTNSTAVSDLRTAFFNSGADFYATPGELYKDMYGLSVVASAKGYAQNQASTLQTAIQAAVLRIWNQGTAQSSPENNPHGLAVFYVNLDALGNAVPSFDNAYLKNKAATVSDPLLFVAQSSWVPDAAAQLGLLYRIWLEIM